MTRTTSTATVPPARLSPLTFALPGILPRHTRVLLDQEAHMTLFLSLDQAEPPPVFCSFQLTPSATRVFLALLQAYPSHCSYQLLFESLFPLPQTEQEDERVWEKTLALRPIRRALAALSPVLRAFGLRVVSLRGQGYALASATETVGQCPEIARQRM